MANDDLYLVPNGFEWQVARLRARGLLREGRRSEEQAGGLLKRLKEEKVFAVFGCKGHASPPHFPEDSQLLLTRHALAAPLQDPGLVML